MPAVVHAARARRAVTQTRRARRAHGVAHLDLARDRRRGERNGTSSTSSPRVRGGRRLWLARWELYSALLLETTVEVTSRSRSERRRSSESSASRLTRDLSPELPRMLSIF